MGKKIDFADLIELVLNNTHSVKYAISSLYPESITDKFCRVIQSERMQGRFHLSVQSGSNDVLKRMGRRYTRENVIEAVEKLRAVKPNCFIACDIIAGFPGETEDDFLLTMDLCQKCNFTWVHAFPFSPRPDTPAYSMTPKVANNIAGKRVFDLTEFAKKSKINFINGCKEKIYSAIVENPRQNSINKSDKEHYIHCVTENFIHARIKTDFLYEQGSLINIKIIKALENFIFEGKELEAEAEIV